MQTDVICYVIQHASPQEANNETLRFSELQTLGNDRVLHNSGIGAEMRHSQQPSILQDLELVQAWANAYLGFM